MASGKSSSLLLCSMQKCKQELCVRLAPHKT